jgi:hypothetical protein
MPATFGKKIPNLVRKKLIKFGQFRDKNRQIWSHLVSFGEKIPTLTKFGQTWSILKRKLPNLVSFGKKITKFGQTIWSNTVKFGQFWNEIIILGQKLEQLLMKSFAKEYLSKSILNLPNTFLKFTKIVRNLTKSIIKI